MLRPSAAVLVLTGLLMATPVIAQNHPTAGQQMDEVYAAKIAEYTTDARFLNELVDHLPYSETVPSPLDYFGTIIGAPDILHYTEEIYGYFRALAEASPRVRVRVIGTTEEGREQIEVIVADETTDEALGRAREYLNALADPRVTSEEEAANIIAQARPVYYLTAGLHSPETGSPEMVMELAYRLAVSETPMVQAIRRNVITVFTPAAEPDGRDRVVDIYRYRSANNGVGPSLTYWGAYAAHDNNRDGFGLALDLTRNILGTFMHWKPTLMHDLHESVSYLYTSTGLGPYNPWIDPITVDEWHNLAYEEVSELTRRGMPGVWTHAFYNGWAANYLIWMANTRNSAGKFYETFGNSIPQTVERELGKNNTSREWYRPNPPLQKTMWSLRNNTNYMQSGVLVALKYMADNRQDFLEGFWIKSRNSLRRGQTEAPYAWVIPRQQLRHSGVTNLVNLLMDQGLEVHTATSEITVGDEVAAIGDYVIRADQPYNTLARVLLEKQDFPEGQNPPYDDTGWTLPLAHNVTTWAVADSSVLTASMSRLSAHVPLSGGISGRGNWLVANHTTDDNFAVLRFELGPDVDVLAAETAFEHGGQRFNSGSYVIQGPIPGLAALSERLGVPVMAYRDKPSVATHAVEVPRVGLIHTWTSTPQDGGWWHFAFDEIGIPYSYLSEQDLATEDLSQFDVLIMPRNGSSPQTLVTGTTRVGPALPWQASEEYPHIGRIDQTDDQRRGMGFDGLGRLAAWIDGGGVFITSGSTAAFPIDMGITRRIAIRQTRNLQARGSIVRTTVADSLSPITYGYEGDIPTYFSAGPVFTVNKGLGDARTPDWYKDLAWAQEVPRTVVSFAEKEVRMSGMLGGESELAGTPAVVDVPVGDGHVVLFAGRPMRRWNTRGNHALVFNTMLHWNDLRVGWPDRPTQDEDEAGDGLLEWAGHH